MDLSQLAAQLKKPEGEIGKQVGEMMNKGNLLLNQWVIDALKLKEGDRVLEIGMGNGFFVNDILSIHPSIHYSGIDYSRIMVEEAIILNKDSINKKRSEFLNAKASSLPFPDNFFTAILSVNTIYFWEDAREELGEIKRVLTPGGRLVLGIRSKKAMEKLPFTEFGFRKYDQGQLIRLMEDSGFSLIKSEIKIEPPYDFNGETIELENIILTCSKGK